MTESDILEKAIVSLANACDGAHTLDDKGFNRYDSNLGRQLALKPFHLWTQRQKITAHSMLAKYRKQLLNYGILYSDIPKPESTDSRPTPKSKSSISLSSDSKNFIITFPYSADLVSAVRSIKGRKWDAKEKHWSVDSGFTESYSELLDFGKLHKFEIELNVHKFISDKSKEVEKQIGDSKATDADIEIDGLGGILRPFQKAGVVYASKHKSVFIADEMGCLSGGTLILVNRGGGGRRYTLEDLYIKFNNLSDIKRHNWDQTIDSFTRSLSVDKKKFRLNRIKKVLYKGIKSVYTLKTRDHFIKATRDHIFFTEGGEKELKDLQIGEYLYTNGTGICPVCGTDKNLVVYKYAKFKGYCKRCVYKHKRYNFARYTSSCGESIDKDGYIVITRNLTYHRHSRAAGIYKHRLVYEAYLNGVSYEDWLEIIKYNNFEKDSVFLTSDICVHHKDGSKTNNLLSNLEAITHREHQKIHGNYMNFGKFFIPKLQCIESITYVGEEKVYDIQMESPNHNFIANGIVVHNCGKTAQALATIQVTNSYPALILCPASLKFNWEREIQKWLPGKTIQVLSSKDVLADTNITILNYDIVKKHFDSLKARNYKIIVMDESHYLKSSKSIRTKLTSKLASKITYKLALTGTPLLNRPQELVSQLGILGRLGDFGGYWNFLKRFCNAKMGAWGWDFSGSSNLDELNNKLRGTCFIRRLKSEVLKELPAKQRVIIPVELSNMKIYDKAESDIVGWIGDAAQNESEFLETIKHLPEDEQVQLKRSEKRRAVRKAESAEHLVRIEALKQIAVQGKMKTAKEWIVSFLETGEKLIIFAHHVQIQKDLLDIFPNSARILAEDSPEIRQENVDKFQENLECKVMIASLQAGGVGITLTAASNVLFLELGWNPATMSQAEDRCHRIGQTDSVTAYYMLGKGTIDEDIYELIEEKRSVIDSAIEDKAIRNTTDNKSILSAVTDRLRGKL